MTDNTPSWPATVDAHLIGMNPASKPTEAELFEMEKPKVGMSRSQSLVACPSSPPPLMKDYSDIPEEHENCKLESEQSSLRNELELATYEYAALEERYRILQGQHRELRRLASDYNDVIRGSSTYEDQIASMEQLRAEAGQEGLRAKALEADVLRPIVHEAGGLNALKSHIQALRWFVEHAGALEGLEDLVSEAHMFRGKMSEVGGPQAFSYLVSEVRFLRSKQHEHDKLRYEIDELNEFKVKAAKYDKLEQAFNRISNDPTNTAMGPDLLRENMPVRIDEQRSCSNGASSISAAMINPARASRISTTSIEDDPDRDLYEPPAPVTEPQNRTGSNNLPLGRSHVSTHSVGETSRRKALKRKGHEELPTHAMKRPRIDVGRASALMQAALPGQSTRRAKPDLTLIDWRIARASDSDYAMETSRGGRLESLIKNPSVGTAPLSTGVTATTSSSSRSRSDIGLFTYSESRSPNNMALPSGLPVIKAENTEDEQVNHYGMNIPIYGHVDLKYTAGTPIAVWIGSGNPDTVSPPSDLRKADEIPSDLANFLLGELTKYASEVNINVWNSMPANRDTCILRYVVDGHRPSDQPQSRRVCLSCSSAWVRHQRPCALLQDVDGVRTIVFLPLQDSLRKGISWKDKRYWALDGWYGLKDH
ncbi:Nn.00g111850.m01.CDS01 [Neocucurbitaria sp. VM-36]